MMTKEIELIGNILEENINIKTYYDFKPILDESLRKKFYADWYSEDYISDAERVLKWEWTSPSDSTPILVEIIRRAAPVNTHISAFNEKFLLRFGPGKIIYQLGDNQESYLYV